MRKSAVRLGLALILVGIIFPLFPLQIVTSVPLETTDKLAYRSEIRFFWMGADNWQAVAPYVEWDVVTDVAVNYNIDAIVAKMVYTHWAAYDSAVTFSHSDHDFLAGAVEMCRAKGLKFFLSSANCLARSEHTQEHPWYCYTVDGIRVDWLDPTNPEFIQHWKDIYYEVITNYDIDGIWFDYCRIDGTSIPFTPSSKAWMQNYLGEDITDWQPFAPGGSRHGEFIEMRAKMVTDYIKTLADYCREIKPSIEIAHYGWSFSAYTGVYGQGQDLTAWALDIGGMVCQDNYVASVSSLLTRIDLIQAGLGGSEGIVPSPIFLMHVLDNKPISTWVQLVENLRNKGCDGFTSWIYNGPGQGGYLSVTPYPEYLDQIELPPTFALRNIQSSLVGSSLTISWNTDLPATTKVEYSATPLFTSKTVTSTVSGYTFNHMGIDYVAGSIFEDTVPKTSHSVTIDGVSEPFYFRIQSADASGIATSKVYNITARAPPTDTMPPTVSILSPENKTYAVEDVPLTFTVSELTSWMGYSLDGQANVTVTGNATLIELSDGMHSLVVYASDMAGNMGASDTVYFTIDTTPTSISIVSPENKTYDTTDIPLTFTVDEPVSWMVYSLDGQANVTISGNTTLSGLSEGPHRVIVYGRDTAGNTGASEMVHFSIEIPQRFPIEIAAVIGLIAVVGAVVLVYFLKFRK